MAKREVGKVCILRLCFSSYLNKETSLSKSRVGNDALRENRWGGGGN